MTGQYYQQTTFVTNGKSKLSHLREDDVDVDEQSKGNNVRAVVKKFWRKLKFDEWTFTLLLFLFSSSIVLGKLFLNHDSFNILDNSIDQFAVPSFSISHSYYKDITDNVIVEVLNEYSWLMKAAFGGFAITAITWFIIYEDSSVPGVNPPSPFSPSKKRFNNNFPETSSFQMNYLVGILNGFLVFIYMCL